MRSPPGLGSDSDDSKVELFAPRFCLFSSQKRARGSETRASFGDGSGEDKEEGTDETATLMKKGMEAGGGGDSDDSKVELFAPRFCLFSSQKRARGGETRARFGDGGGEDKEEGAAMEPRKIATSSCGDDDDSSQQ